MSKISFEGRVAIVTGGGGGIGRAHALELAGRGCAGVVNDLGGDVAGRGGSASMAECVVDEIVKAGGKAVANHDSVADSAAVPQIRVCQGRDHRPDECRCDRGVQYNTLGMGGVWNAPATWGVQVGVKY